MRSVDHPRIVCTALGDTLAVHGETRLASLASGLIAVPDAVRQLPRPVRLSPVHVEALAGVLDRRDIAPRPDDGCVRHVLQRSVAEQMDMRRGESKANFAAGEQAAEVLDDGLAALHRGMVRGHQHAVGRPNRPQRTASDAFAAVSNSAVVLAMAARSTSAASRGFIRAHLAIKGIERINPGVTTLSL